MHPSPRINWTNTLFLTLTPLIGLVGTILLVGHGSFHWGTLWLALGLMAASGISITGGYHRVFAHRSYQASWPVRFFFLMFGIGAFEGSVLEWCTDHRNHHLHTDTDKDPYNIKRGFWFAHIGWLLMLDPTQRDFNNVKDLKRDALVRFQHTYFVPLAIFMGFLLPMGIAALWGDPWGGLLIAGALRITAVQQTTFCINSVCHMFGKHDHAPEKSPRDNGMTALLTFGEGFHSFHHRFPVDYRNGFHFYHYDPTKWVIKLLSWVGLTKNLIKVNTTPKQPDLSL